MAKGPKQFAVEFVARASGWSASKREAITAVEQTAAAAEKSSTRFQRSQAVMEKAAVGASQRVEQARQRHADATAKAEIAEKKLEEATKTYGGSSSKAAEAELRLTQAKRSTTAANGAVTKAVGAQEIAQKRLADATAAASREAEQSSSKMARLRGAVSDMGDRADRVASGGLDRLKGSLGGLARMAGTAALGVAAGVGAGAVKLVSMAGRAEQAVGGVQSVFGKYADVIVTQSKKAADGFGLSATAYQELATTMGATLKNKGVTDYTTQTQKLVELGGDLAATYGGTAKEAVEALGSAMRGESDPIERYGVSLNEAAIKAKLAEMGITGVATEAEKAQARLLLVMEQTTAAQGQASREHDTYAASLERVKAQAENAAVGIGEQLLPVAAKFLTDVVEPQIPRIGEWGRQFGTGASEFIDGMTRSGGDRTQLTKDLTTWGEKGLATADAIRGIRNAVEWASKATGTGGKPEQKAYDFSTFETFNPGKNNRSYSEQLDWNKQWQDQYAKNFPTLADHENDVGDILHKWNQDFIDWGLRQDASTAAWFERQKATWGRFWGEMGEATRQHWVDVGQYVADGWGEWEASHDAWLARLDGRWQGFWTNLIQGGTDGANGLGADAELHRGEYSVADDTWLIGIGERWGRFWTDRGTTQGERWASLRADIGTKWGEWEIGHDEWLIRINERFNRWLTDTWTDLGTGWATLRSDIGTKWSEWEIAHNEWLARQNANLNGWLTRMGSDAGTLTSNMVDLMGRAWDGLPERFKQPVRDLVAWLNTNLISGVNTLASKVGLGDKWLGDIPTPMADGGITNREPQIRNRPILWAEAGPEAYIPLGPEKRTRSLSLWQEVGRQLGATPMANGAVFPLPAGTYRQTQGLHGADGGYDYAALLGTPVRANADATVTTVADRGNTSYGKYIQLSNGSLYAHLSAQSVSVGQTVAAGQTIGRVGYSGGVRPPGILGTHLHYVPAGALGTAAPLIDIGQMFQNALGDVAGKAQAALGSSPWGSLLAKIPGSLAEGALKTLKDKALAGLDAAMGAVQSGGNFALAGAMATGRGWSPANTAALLWLIQKESGGRVNATNPSSGAYGIPQALPGSKMASAGADWRTNPRTQITWMEDYIEDRFGSAVAAKAFHQSHNWYDGGGRLRQGPSWVMNHSGADELILNGPQERVVTDAMSLIRGARTDRATASGTSAGGPDTHVHLHIDEGRMRGLIRTEVRQMAREGAL